MLYEDAKMQKIAYIMDFIMQYVMKCYESYQ